MKELDLAAPTARLLDAMPDMVYAVDLDGRIRWWNEQVPETTGYGDDALLGMDAFELLPPDDREVARMAFENTESLAPNYTMEFDVVTRSGDRRPHEFNGMVAECDQEPMVVTIARDVTSRHERETAMRRHRDELDTLNRISEAVHEVIQAVVDAASREGVEAVVAEQLVASELYRAVWIGRRNPDGSLELRTALGETGDFPDVIDSLDELDWRRPAAVAAETGEVQVVQTLPESDLPERVRDLAAERGLRSGTSVPIVHRETVLGVLTVLSGRPDAFSEREQAAFRRLGSVIGFAINAVQTERLLLSDTATELTFRITGPSAFLASVSEVAAGPARQEWCTPVDDTDGNYRHYVTVEDVDPGAVLDVCEENATIEQVEHVGTDGDEHVFTVVTTDSITRRLLDVGATPTSVVASDGEIRVVAEIPGEEDARPVVEAAGELYDADLVSKRAVDRPVRTGNDPSPPVAGGLTDQQRAALRHAHLGGYFSWPRDATAEEVAASMGVTSPTFHYHIRGAQRALVESYLDTLDS